jgi:hypothetical protein
MSTTTKAPTQAQIVQAAQQAIAASGINCVLPRNVQGGNQLYTINPKKAANNQAVHNQQHWAGIQAMLAASGGSATANQLLMACVFGAPHNVGNASKYLGYAIARNAWLVPTK